MGFHHIIPERGKKVIPISSSTLSKLGCSNCTLDHAKLEHPKMEPTGSNKPELYFIGEAPGETEDDEGEQFVGLTGQMIRTRIPSKWKRKIRWNNTIRCRPPSNRAPTKLEIECCRRLQVADIVESKPTAVVGFGGVPLQWFTGETQIRDVWRGRKLALRLTWKGDHHDFWYFPMMHPSFVNRMGGNSRRGSDWGDVFSADLKRVFDEMEAGLEPPFTVVSPEQMLRNIKCWKPGDDLEYWTNELRKRSRDKVIGFDIETTGLLPYDKDAMILTASVSYGTDHTIAFPLRHPEAGLRDRELALLFSALREGLVGAAKVICQNTPFEQEWLLASRADGFTPEVVHSIKWGDTLGQSYTLDERQGAGSLDLLTLQHLGIRVKSLSTVDTSNLINEPLKDVLPYNGTDSKSCRMVWFIQRAIQKERGLVEVSEMHERRSYTVAALMSRGLVPNMAAAEEFHEEYAGKINKLESQIDAIEGLPHDFNPHTPADVKAALIKLGHDVPDTRDDTLSHVRHPLAKYVRELREVSTLQDRYITPMVNGKHIQDDGKIHSRISLYRTATGRPASEDPNVQNFPKREHREVRRIIRASPGHSLLAADFGQIEFRVIGMATQDKNLVKACWTGYDVHGYWLDKIVKAYPRWQKAKGMGKLTKEGKKRRKSARDRVKNEWVFPGFFGASLASRAGYLGIPEEYLVDVDEEFWNDFPTVKASNEELLHKYKMVRYVETLTGRRRHWGKGGPLSPNEIINTRIQGTASDIVVDAMERLDAAAIEYGEPWLAPVLNIHDDLTFDIPNSQLDYAIPFIGKTMCLCEFDFINVPLIVEASVGKTWDALEEVRVFNSKSYRLRLAA